MIRDIEWVIFDEVHYVNNQVMLIFIQGKRSGLGRDYYYAT
jgi:hypothetical protein